MISTAVSADRVSAVVGYEVKGSLEGLTPGNLPQRIAILAEIEEGFTYSSVSPFLSFTSSKEVGKEYGFKSPAYAAARILRPKSGDVLGGIPTVIYAIEKPAGATATVITKSITGTATKNKTHYLRVNGRTQLDGQVYQFSVEIGDTATEIAPKIRDAVNAVLGCPGTGSVSTDNFVFTSGWNGETSADINIEFDVDGDSAGLTYAEVSKVDGTGTGSVGTALDLFADEWNTIVVNCLGSNSAILDSLEGINGNPNDGNGRYESIIFKPFVSLFGDNSINTLSGITAITDARKDEVTNVHCPAPNSNGLSLEAAANVAIIYGAMAQNTPHLDPIYKTYPDMPVGSTIGDYGDVSKRDQIIKIGGSTVKLTGDKYQIIDLVTTYHPDDEPDTAVLYRYVKDLVGLDWNYRYSYMLLEQIYVVGKTIVGNNSTSSQEGIISPNIWKSILAKKYFPVLEDKALLADQDYSKASMQVGINASNSNRFDTSFKTKRTGTVRVGSTTNEVLFNFS